MIQKVRHFPLFFLALLFISTACTAQENKPLTDVPTAVKSWETGPVLTTCESVLFDEVGKRLFVSCINGSPVEKDGNGFIAILDPEGKILNEKWATGLDAPKGMGVFGNSLFVTDIQRVVEIDIASGKVIRDIPVEGSGFLNDITVDSKGTVYVSDMKTNTIYTISQGKYSIMPVKGSFENLNGLLYIDNSLYAGTKNKLFKIDMGTMSASEIVSGTGSIDGLASDGKGSFLISDWSGKVQFIDASHKIHTLFDETTKGINAADICFSRVNNMLYVPTFLHNTVLAYKIVHADK